MKLSKVKVLFIVFGTFFPLLSVAQTENPFKDFHLTLEKLGFSNIHRNYSMTPKKRIKIAVLDKGFSGLDSARGKSLPGNLVYHPGLNEPEEQTSHGRVMAEILFQALTNLGKDDRFYPAEFHLYNVNGFTNFQRAIDDLIARNIDVVLYSEVWEIGGNWDGLGFINSEINRATGSGVLWINAAGNFATRTYQAPIVTLEEGWLDLPDSNNALIVECIPRVKKTCDLSATLSWNDFKDQEGIGTDKDLDFALYDDFMDLIERSTLDQVIEFGSQDSHGQSQYPRESIRAELQKGTYFLKVKNRSQNFSSSDKFRITIDGLGINIPSGQSDESLLNPADNASVITVGASDSELSSKSKKLGKPDVVTVSSIVLSENNEEYRGSSNSAALFAAGASIYKMFFPNVGRGSIVGRLTRPPSKSNGGSPGNANQRGFDSREATDARLRQGLYSTEYPSFYIPANIY